MKVKLADIQAALLRYLKGSTPLQDVCGQRGYKDVAKSDAKFPHYVVDQISQIPDRDTLGATGGAESLLQVSGYSRTSKDRQRLRAALVAVCEAIPRNMGGAVVLSLDVEYHDSQEPSEDKSAAPVFRTRADVRLMHRHTATTRS